MNDADGTSTGTLSAFTSVTDCKVRLSNGEEIPAIMDTDALRAVHGRVMASALVGL
jgi:hypothetical protein